MFRTLMAIAAIIIIILFACTLHAEEPQTLRFATAAQVAVSGVNVLSSKPVYSSGETFYSQVLPLGVADSIWGSFTFGDTVDVDIYLVFVRFSGSTVGLTTSSRLDSLIGNSGNNSIVTKTGIPSAYRGYVGYQWKLIFQTYASVAGSPTAYLRKFEGNSLRKNL